MALKFTPRDDRFYSMFSAAAKNLVTGAALLRKQIDAGVDDRSEVAARMRDTEHAGDEITHEIFTTGHAPPNLPRLERDVRDPVRPRGHQPARGAHRAHPRPPRRGRRSHRAVPPG